MTIHVKNIVELLTVNEARTRKFTKGITDVLGYGEKSLYPRFFAEGITFEVVPSHTAQYQRELSPEDIAYADSHVKLFTKMLYDEVSMTETYYKSFKKNITESLLVTDTLLRNANAVMFDLVLRNDVVSADELAAMADSPPLGYTPFQQFYPGDYKYSETMVGVRLRSFDTEGRAGILGLTLNVDVPDVTDRGSAEIEPGSESGITVNFAKSFTVPPEVYVVFAAGPTAAAPEIIEVTTTGFTFILRDISNPATLVDGAVTWAAIGR